MRKLIITRTMTWEAEVPEYFVGDLEALAQAITEDDPDYEFTDVEQVWTD